MRKISYHLFGCLLLLLFLAFSVNCGQLDGEAEETQAGKSSSTHAFPSKKAPQAKDMAEAFKGTVMEIIDTSRHTYVQIDTGEKKVWVAVPNFDGSPGDDVSVPPGIPVADFHSRTLDREFGMMYFVGGVDGAGDSMADRQSKRMPKDHPDIGGAPGSPNTHPPMNEDSGASVDIGTVKKAKDGQTVSEIITERKRLAGKKIRVRAKVVKFTPDIMDKNWLHVRDGSGDEGSNDLIVTTEAQVRVGDTVLVQGRVVIDRDLGYGLEYPVIVENADVTVEE